MSFYALLPGIESVSSSYRHRSRTFLDLLSTKPGSKGKLLAELHWKRNINLPVTPKWSYLFKTVLKPDNHRTGL